MWPFTGKGHLCHHLRNKTCQVFCEALNKSYWVIPYTSATLTWGKPTRWALCWFTKIRSLEFMARSSWGPSGSVKQSKPWAGEEENYSSPSTPPDPRILPPVRAEGQWVLAWPTRCLQGERHWDRGCTGVSKFWELRVSPGYTLGFPLPSPETWQLWLALVKQKDHQIEFRKLVPILLTLPLTAF